MIGLCIAETYHRSDCFRVEYFKDLKELQSYMKTLGFCTTWILGEPIPKRKQVIVFTEKIEVKL